MSMIRWKCWFKLKYAEIKHTLWLVTKKHSLKWFGHAQCKDHADCINSYITMETELQSKGIQGRLYRMLSKSSQKVQTMKKN